MDIPAPKDLLAIVAKATAHHPAERYPSANELAQELKRFQAGQFVGVHTYSLREVLTRWLKENTKVVWSLAGMLAAFVAIFGVVGWLSLRNEEEFLLDDLELKSAQLLRALAIPAAVPLAKNRLAELDDYISGFTQEGQDLDLNWVAVLDGQGKVLTHTDPEQFFQVMQDPFSREALEAKNATFEWDEEQRLLQVAAPIAISGLSFGVMRAEMSLARLDKRIASLRLEWALLFGSGFLVMFFGVAVFLSLSVVRSRRRSTAGSIPG